MQSTPRGDALKWRAANNKNNNSNDVWLSSFPVVLRNVSLNEHRTLNSTARLFESKQTKCTVDCLTLCSVVIAILVPFPCRKLIMRKCYSNVSDSTHRRRARMFNRIYQKAPICTSCNSRLRGPYASLPHPTASRSVQSFLQG